MKQIFSWALCSLLFFACKEKAETENIADESAAVVAKAPAEFADTKYSDIGKRTVAALGTGDVDGWLTAFADNAVYVWNNGDSIAGKENIGNYWRERRTNVIDSLSFSNQIWLPLQVNQPQSVEQPGVWLLNWQSIDVKYKTGKKMRQMTHMAMHFNTEEKIDRIIHYLDRAPIASATSK